MSIADIFSGKLSAHFLGDCPVCGEALVPYRFTPNEGQRWYGMACSVDIAHHIEFVSYDPPPGLSDE